MDSLPGTIASIDATAEGVASGLEQISEALKGPSGNGLRDRGACDERRATHGRPWRPSTRVTTRPSSASPWAGTPRLLSRASKTLSALSGLLGAQIDQLGVKIADLDGQIEELGRAIEENEGKLADLTSRIEELSGSLTPESSPDLEGLLNQKMELEGTLGEQRKSREDLQGQRDALQGQLDSYVGYQTSLDPAHLLRKR